MARGPLLQHSSLRNIATVTFRAVSTGIASFEYLERLKAFLI